MVSLGCSLITTWARVIEWLTTLRERRPKWYIRGTIWRKYGHVLDKCQAYTTVQVQWFSYCHFRVWITWIMLVNVGCRLCKRHFHLIPPIPERWYLSHTCVCQSQPTEYASIIWVKVFLCLPESFSTAHTSMAPSTKSFWFQPLQSPICFLPHIGAVEKFSLYMVNSSSRM